MYKVEAIVREDKYEDVQDALKVIHVNGMTISQVMGCGTNQGYSRTVRGRKMDILVTPKIKFEIVVSSLDWADRTVAAIRSLHRPAWRRQDFCIRIKQCSPYPY